MHESGRRLNFYAAFTPSVLLPVGLPVLLYFALHYPAITDKILTSTTAWVTTVGISGISIDTLDEMSFQTPLSVILGRRFQSDWLLDGKFPMIPDAVCNRITYLFGALNTPALCW
jgi:hypothetical protein